MYIPFTKIYFLCVIYKTMYPYFEVSFCNNGKTLRNI